MGDSEGVDMNQGEQNEAECVRKGYTVCGGVWHALRTALCHYKHAPLPVNVTTGGDL